MGEEEQDGAVPCSLPSSKTMHSPHPEKLHLSIVAEIFLKDYLLVLAVGFRYLSRVQWFRPTVISFTVSFTQSFTPLVKNRQVLS